jgi:hypothetical protein
VPRCQGWCGACYTNARSRTNIRGHYGYRKPHVHRELKPWERDMKKPERSPDGAVGSGAPGKGSFFSTRPCIWGYLTDDKWDDGSKRERASILFVADGPTAKVWLNDRATARSAWATGETLDEALDQLEEMLATDAAPWRATDGTRKKK